MGSCGEREYYRIWERDVEMKKLRLLNINFKIGFGFRLRNF